MLPLPLTFKVSLTLRLSVAFALCLFAALDARAQDLDEVSFAGVVVDSNGAVVQGANVTATLADTNSARSVVTDGEGRYRLVELRPGAYTLRAESKGFAADVRADVHTLAGQSVRLDFKLGPALVSVEQTIVSESEAPIIDTTRTVTGGTVTREELERLPSLTRAPLDFVFTLGGVTEEPLSTRDTAEDRDASARSGAQRSASTPEEAGTFALAGGAAYSNNVTVDGLDNNDDRAARERFQPSLEAVEEVQVITNQFSAEYGRASGGRVNLRTRSGSNRLRGRAFYFFEDESLNANTWNNNRRGLKRLPLQEHNHGFTLGGPLVLPQSLFGRARYDGRERTFFFISYEHVSLLDSALIDAPCVPAKIANCPAKNEKDSCKYKEYSLRRKQLYYSIGALCAAFLFIFAMVGAGPQLGRMFAVVEEAEFECPAITEPVVVLPVPINTEVQLTGSNPLKLVAAENQPNVFGRGAFFINGTGRYESLVGKIGEIRVCLRIISDKGFSQIYVHVEGGVESGGSASVLKQNLGGGGLSGGNIVQSNCFRPYIWTLHQVQRPIHKSQLIEAGGGVDSGREEYECCKSSLNACSSLQAIENIIEPATVFIIPPTPPLTQLCFVFAAFCSVFGFLSIFVFSQNTRRRGMFIIIGFFGILLCVFFVGLGFHFLD